jgi:2-C-methyl-D-erythritol 4-phosphate cytidylyltransferase
MMGNKISYSRFYRPFTISYFLINIYFMKSNSQDEITTKAVKREKKNRPRMKVSGASLRKPSKFAGFKAVKKRQE